MRSEYPPAALQPVRYGIVAAATVVGHILAPAGQSAPVAAVVHGDRGIAGVMPAQTAGAYALLTAVPRQDPSDPAVGATIDRLRRGLPEGALIGC
jgi:RND superfamily putative drug exporter